MNELPWLTLAKSMLGTHERLPNGKDNPVVLDMLARMNLGAGCLSATSWVCRDASLCLSGIGQKRGTIRAT